MAVREKVNMIMENSWVVDSRVFEGETYVWVVRRRGLRAEEDVWNGKVARLE